MATLRIVGNRENENLDFEKFGKLVKVNFSLYLKKCPSRSNGRGLGMCIF